MYPNTSRANDEGFLAAALGIFFSVGRPNAVVTEAEVKIIDDFFESLMLSTTSGLGPTVLEANYGDLVNMVDKTNRWVYKGSVTTPPCAQKVYWNVLKTIYPIK